jgi:hypothetical protein
MANNVGRIIETSSKISPPASSRGISALVVEQESEASPVPDLPSQPLIEKQLRTQFHKISENIDSPKALLMIRNAALTVLELNELKLVGQENKRSLDLSSLLSL